MLSDGMSFEEVSQLLSKKSGFTGLAGNEIDYLRVINKYTEKKTSLVMIDEIKNQLSRMSDIDWFSTQCSNHGMLHSYSTAIGTEKSWWVPFSEIEDDEL